MPRFFFFALLLALLPSRGYAQLRVVVEAVPAYTPAEDTLFIAGSFNDWTPGDARFGFARREDGSYVYDFLTPMPDFTYKITRGNWSSVEGGRFAEAIDDRGYTYNEARTDTIRLTVASWEDMPEFLPALDSLTLVVTDIPDNTPPDASLFVTGSFNGWSPMEQEFKMKKSADGSFRTTIPLRAELTEFKITRGSWRAIEGRKNGLAVPNRKYLLSGHQTGTERFISIENWEDLAGSGFGFYSILLLLAAVQLLLLLVVINTFRARNPLANRLLSSILLLLAVTILARLGAFDREVFRAFPKLVLVPDLLYFLLGPLCWLYYRAGVRDDLDWRRDGWHFLPFLFASAFYVPLILKSGYGFTSEMVTDGYRPFFLLSAAMGCVLTLAYWWLLCGAGTQDAKTVLKEQSSQGRYLRTSFGALTVPLATWIAATLIGVFALLTGRELTPVTDGLVDAAWLLLSPMVYVVAYYVFRHPRIFRVPPSTGVSSQKARDAAAVHPGVLLSPPTSTDASTDPDFERLTELMTSARPYLNPGLTVAELANQVQMPAYLLSRLINETAGQNFFDYVNGYRIEAFKDRIREGDGDRKTILAVALEVGFNSKTAFNRAFKKREGVSPRAYFKSSSL